ncbi:type II secretion system protein [Massilia pseudoviolaceinigra]|uniref:type II secretion system protein n=1 Tax=Massilia pseudoviolaceinigra TaxID=3057165 RepID=UPI00279678D4|nr:type II secretion system protein [Massilia sp. CCM 9206]MDQ1921142.1 type II secretion system protein [Massilia sp. CCM 9206]
MRQIATPPTLSSGCSRRGGFSLLEMAVCTVVMAVLTGVLLQRLLYYREQAELAAVEQLAGVLRSALVLKIGQLQARGKEAEIPSLIGKNPIDWLAEKPRNYAGEYFAPTPAQVGPGNWYFDLKTKTLVYLISGEKKFPRGTAKRIDFKVEFTRLPTIPAKQSGTSETRTVALTQVNS